MAGAGNQYAKRICSVENCSSTSAKNPELIFHVVPPPKQRTVKLKDFFGNDTTVDRHEAWKRILNLKEVKKSTRICSLHFKREDYVLSEYEELKCRNLKKSTVPSLNIPDSHCGNNSFSTKNISRLNRKIQRDIKKEIVEKTKTTPKEIVEKTKTTPKENSSSKLVQNDRLVDNSKDKQISDCSTNTASVPKSLFEPQVIVIEGLFRNKDSLKPSNWTVKKVDVGIQATSKTSKFLSQLKSNVDLSTATGIESFDIFYTIVDCVKLIVGDKYETNTIMNTADRVLMTYVKLKQNISYRFLYLLFDSVSERQCQRIFIQTIEILSKSLKFAIRWPSREEIHKNFPQRFKEFENLRIVLNCTEIEIQKPKNHCCQILTNSHVKSGQKVKVMTGVTPSGDISYVSKAYGARTSDSFIFEQSDLMNFLEAGDSIMVDKSFHIKDICDKNQWELIQSPSKARVHILRTNQKIKAFKILGSTMPTVVVPYFDDIFTVICATINLTSPVVKDSKLMN